MFSDILDSKIRKPNVSCQFPIAKLFLNLEEILISA